MSSFVFGNNVNREDTENLGPRRVKQANAGLTTRNAPKRAALGSISNNIRVQPSRAAKVCNKKFEFSNKVVQKCEAPIFFNTPFYLLKFDGFILDRSR